MKKTFITNLFLVLALNLSIKPFWIFFIDRKVQNLVGNEEYGTYSSLFSFSYLFWIICDMGITSFNNRHISQNAHLLSKHFSRILVLKLLLGLAYLLVCTIAGFALGYDIRRMKLLLILCFIQFLISFIAYLRSNISGLHYFKTDSAVSVLDRLIGIAICAPFIWGFFAVGPIDIMDYVYAQTAAYGLTALIAFWITFKKAGFTRFDWTKTFSIMILKKSYPYAVLVALMAFNNRIDQVMLERMLKDNGREAGVYAQAFRLLDAANMIAVLTAGLLLPMFSRMLKYKESIEPLVKTSYTVLLTLAIVVASGSFFYGQDIMKMLYPKIELSESPVIFKLLMCCFLGAVTQYVFGTLLTANGNLKQLNIIAASGMVLNVTLNFIVIPRLFATGSAMSSLSSYSLVAIAQMIIAQRIFKFHSLSKLLITLLIFTIGVLLTGYFTSHLKQDWKITFCIMLMVSAVWAWVIGLANIKSLVRVIKYE